MNDSHLTLRVAPWSRLEQPRLFVVNALFFLLILLTPCIIRCNHHMHFICLLDIFVFFLKKIYVRKYHRKLSVFANAALN